MNNGMMLWLGHIFRGTLNSLHPLSGSPVLLHKTVSFTLNPHASPYSLALQGAKCVVAGVLLFGVIPLMLGLLCDQVYVCIRVRQSDGYIRVIPCSMCSCFIKACPRWGWQPGAARPPCRGPVLIHSSLVLPDQCHYHHHNVNINHACSFVLLWCVWWSTYT